MTTKEAIKNTFMLLWGIMVFFAAIMGFVFNVAFLLWIVERFGTITCLGTAIFEIFLYFKLQR